MNNENIYHIWPDDTWCRSEDLEEYLTFMSDDYITIVVSDELDEGDIPTYSNLVIGHLKQVWGMSSEEGNAIIQS